MVLAKASEQARAIDSREKDCLEVTAYSLLDSLIELTTITIDRNEQGDTLKQSVVTDRLRTRTKEKAKEVEVRTVEKHDTVYIATRDSVFVSNTDRANGTDSKPIRLQKTLRLVLWIIIALAGLVVINKVLTI